MNKVDASKVEYAIKSLRLVAKVESFNPTDYENYEAEDLHYGAEIALKHLLEIELNTQEKETMKTL